MTIADPMEDIINATGGCGLHQLLLCIIIHFSRISATWSFIGMTFIGHNPGFYCNTMFLDKKTLDAFSMQNMSSVGLCSFDETSECVSYQFLGKMSTSVSEWNLVCKNKWIVGLITSMQMIGCMLGCIISGYISDAYGRKPTFFAGLLSTVTLNLTGYFIQSLEFYVVIRSLIGVATGVTNTTMFLLIVEFLPTNWRSIVTAVPSGALSQSMFALLCWKLQDWRFLPESVRWLMTKRKFKQARQTVYAAASFNRRERPDLSGLLDESQEDLSTSDENKRQSYLVLFKTKDIRRITTSLNFVWFTFGFSYYGILFGVNILSGNLFLNLFLLTIIDAPFAVPAGLLANRFGRRKCCIVAMGYSGICATVVGVLQYTEFLGNTYMTTVMALFSKLACSCALVGVRVYTLELYPTIIRAIGFGFQNTVYRIASAVVPHALTLNDDIAGLFYFTTGILLVISSVVTFFLPETANKSLADRLTGT